MEKSPGELHAADERRFFFQRVERIDGVLHFPQNFRVRTSGGMERLFTPGRSGGVLRKTGRELINGFLYFCGFREKKKRVEIHKSTPKHDENIRFTI